jgi:ethanolamine phosphate transferase 2 subunit G
LIRDDVLLIFPPFRSKPKSKTSYTSSITAALLAIRLIRSWNQTGQKFAGEPDLVKIFLSSSPPFLWILASATYLWIHRELVRGFDGLPTAVNVAGLTGLVLAAFSFKVAFTKEDSPELVGSFAKTFVDITKGASLVTRARAVFIGLGIAATCVIIFVATQRRISSKVSGEPALPNTTGSFLTH